MHKNNPSVIENWSNFLEESKKEFHAKYGQRFVSDLKFADFELTQTIGQGSYGTVVVGKTSDGKYHAIKIMKKKELVKKNQVEQTLIEKRILAVINFPFIIHMEYFFLDNTYLSFVMPFMPGGDMFTLLRKVRKFNEDVSVFYAAQVVLAFEFLHYLSIIYRDLKPENILLDAEGYVKIVDLGFAKMVFKRTYTLCGTPDYLAPEIILSRGYAHQVDWWALGVLLFEMNTGYPPFFSRDVTETYLRIVKRSLDFPRTFSVDLKELVDGLLQVDTSRRLGSLVGGVNDIKSHRWFRRVKWMSILNKAEKAPIIPSVKSLGDTSNFDKYNDFSPEVNPVDTFKDHFKDF